MASFAQQIAEFAVYALYAELDTTPKPGLIDKNNNGAHKDMDYNTMAKSITALSPYLEKFVEVSLEAKDIEQLATALKLVGINAERAMYKATNGINTHKGAIFLFGLFIGAMCYEWEEQTSLGTITYKMGKIAEILSTLHTQDNSHGNTVSKEYNIPSVLEQAKTGFFSVLFESFCILLLCDELQLSDNTARVQVLVKLMANINDTTVYYRGGQEGADLVKKEAENLIKDFSILGVERLDKVLIEKNISCGGAADLLALSIFIYNLYKADIIDLGQDE